MEEENKKKPDSKPSTEKQKPKKKKPQEDFKRKYFEFYDDIKISDRQDW